MVIILIINFLRLLYCFCSFILIIRNRIHLSLIITFIIRGVIWSCFIINFLSLVMYCWFLWLWLIINIYFRRLILFIYYLFINCLIINGYVTISCLINITISLICIIWWGRSVHSIILNLLNNILLNFIRFYIKSNKEGECNYHENCVY